MSRQEIEYRRDQTDTSERGGVSNDSSPFRRVVREASQEHLVDDLLPDGVLLTRVPAEYLNGFINHVDVRTLITERDPDEDERFINESNRFYTHFHEFGTVVHAVASSERYWWYFCYDVDSSDCSIGRVERARSDLPELVQWIYRNCVSRKYPVQEIDVRKLHGWKSFR